MRKLLLLPLLCLMPPAQAQWGGGTASTAASAYCGARAAGLSQEEASRRASQVVTGSMSGSFESNLATILTSRQGMKDAINFQIEQQCPEYSGSSSSRLEETPITAETCSYYGKLCETLGLTE